MAELADAPDLGSGPTRVQVQVLLPAFFQETVSLFPSRVVGRDEDDLVAAGQKLQRHAAVYPRVLDLVDQHNRSRSRRS